MLFHTFWNSRKTLNDPLLLIHIQSHLYTQNRRCSNLIVWTLPTIYGEIDSKYNVHAPHLQFRSLKIFVNELREVGINIGSYWSWLSDILFTPNTTVISDAVRFVVLHKLGGMYIDADILLLRDLQPFYPHEFAYRWSTLVEFNTAILRLHPKSNVSSNLIDQARRSQSPSIFFPLSIRSSIYPTTLNRLPSVFFDPLWLVANDVDRQTAKLWKLSEKPWSAFENVFRSQSELSRQGRIAFNGAFAFHWHALYKTGVFEQGSFLYQWKQFLENHLLERT